MGIPPANFLSCAQRETSGNISFQKLLPLGFFLVHSQRAASHRIASHRIARTAIMLHKVESGTWLPSYVPESSSKLAMLLILCSVVQSTTGGYDGSMLNGLNILPSYTDYFKLTPATTGINTASIFIGGFFGPMAGGYLSDRVGRRPAILWSSLITIVGIILQSAAQNVAMFCVARVVLGFGAGISSVAGAVYLSETFPARWRAWGVGVSRQPELINIQLLT